MPRKIIRPFIVPKPTNDGEAWALIMGGIGHFLATKFKTTIIILAAMLAGLLLGIYVLADKGYSIKEIAPVGEAPPAWTLIPRAYAGGEPIVFGGKEYPYPRDPDFELAKIQGESAMLVWDKRMGRVYRIEILDLNRESLKKFSK